MSISASARQGQVRVACVQLDSKHADVDRNTNTVLSLVTELIDKKKATPIDLLVLPELALTGYVFKSRDEIDPYLEDARKFKPPVTISPDQPLSALIAACTASSASSHQPSLTLAAHLAQQLRCHVVIGFPEIGTRHRFGDSIPTVDALIGPPFDARPEDARSPILTTGTDADGDDQGCAFNSAALMGPDGDIKHIFRKHFLFETDEVWAAQGSGFEAISLPGLGNVCVAICMDLNPFRFRTDFEKCELASFCVQNDVDLLVMPMAWLLPKDEQQKLAQHDQVSSKSAPSLSTINYWALRCMPFFDLQHPATHLETSPTATQSGASSHQPKTRYLVANNRTGTEATSVFAGSSCVLEMKPGERPLLLDSLGSTDQACLVVTFPARSDSDRAHQAPPANP